MTFQEALDRREMVATSPCIHLRSKMFWVAEQLGGPAWDEEDGFDCNWCNLTQHVLGPDDADVNRQSCVPGRSCYRET